MILLITALIFMALCFVPNEDFKNNRCSDCKGSGKQINPDGLSVDPCELCNGTGKW